MTIARQAYIFTHKLRMKNEAIREFKEKQVNIKNPLVEYSPYLFQNPPFQLD